MIADLVRNKKLEARLAEKTKEADEARKRAEESDKRADTLSAENAELRRQLNEQKAHGPSSCPLRSQPG